MDWQKTACIGGIIALSMVLLFKWNQFQEERQIVSSDRTVEESLPQAISTTANTSNPGTDFIAPPEDDTSQRDNTIEPTAKNSSDKRYITVETDVFKTTLDLYGGDIIRTDLLQHKLKLDGEQSITLLDDNLASKYVAQSGIVGPNATDTKKGRPTFSSTQQSHRLEEGQDNLIVDLLYTQNETVSITKRFEFKRGDYLINVSYLIDNQSQTPWQGKMFGRIVRDNHEPPAAADSGIGVSPYLGAATTSEENQYQEIEFQDLDKNSRKFSYEGGWVAMVQHYFISAWVPKQDEMNDFLLSKSGFYYLLNYTSPLYTIDPGQRGELSGQFYAGPKDMDRLEAISNNLDLTLDFSFLWWIAKPLFQLLDFLHTYLGNWGWSIIGLTIVIKAIFFYPSAVSYRSMAKMRKVSPKMKDIKDRFGDDKQKMSKAMMDLYKKEKVNPMGGCLPILIQMPVFISLYWVLMESVELRHAPFILWIEDLSVKDPYFIFPLLMGITMYIQQKLNPTPPDPMQAKIMQWMPVAFTFMFLWFPAGLVIYWVTNNTLSIIQQYIITRNIERADLKES